MKKLIDEYQNKVTAMDLEIQQLTNLIRGIRKGKSHYLTVEEIVNDRKVVDAKRMQLVQVIKDLEDHA
jgi:hypothetical protein